MFFDQTPQRVRRSHRSQIKQRAGPQKIPVYIRPENALFARDCGISAPLLKILQRLDVAAPMILLNNC
jgi:hypothetical protein